MKGMAADECLQPPWHFAADEVDRFLALGGGWAKVDPPKQ